MELQKETAIFTNGKRLRHIIFRPTCNQRAVQIQELVARRQNQCRDMADNMLSDLKKLHALRRFLFHARSPGSNRASGGRLVHYG